MPCRQGGFEHPHRSLDLGHLDVIFATLDFMIARR